jgi:hypothetical protein
MRTVDQQFYKMRILRGTGVIDVDATAQFKNRRCRSSMVIPCPKSSDVAWLSGTLDDIEPVRLRLLYFTV